MQLKSIVVERMKYILEVNPDYEMELKMLNQDGTFSQNMKTWKGAIELDKDLALRLIECMDYTPKQ